MYVSCAVVSLSSTDVNFNTPPLTWIATLMLTREHNAELPFNKETKEASLPTDSCLNNKFKASKLGQLHLDQSRVSKRSPMACVQSQPGPHTTGICSLCHRAFMGSFKSSRPVRRQSVFTKFRAAYCHCTLPLLS